MMTIGYGSRIKENSYYDVYYTEADWGLPTYINEATDKVKNLIS